MNRTSLISATLGSAIFAMANLASAATFTVTFQEGVNGYVGTLDTYTNEDKKSSSYGNETTFQADNNVKNSLTSWKDTESLLRFTNLFVDADVQDGTPSLTFIPTDATISSATLSIYCSDSGNSGKMYRMGRDWNESSTWDSLSGGAVNDHGVQDATYSGSSGWQNYAVTSTLQTWLANPSTNFGWVFDPNGGLGDSTAWRSSEYSDPSYRPKLTVTFDVVTVPEPTTLAALTIGAIAALRRRMPTARLA
jgi:hypothetical protein